MAFMEELLIKVVYQVKRDCADELKLLGRELSVPSTPFKVFRAPELEKEFGKDFEKIVSERETEPFWILDHEREFYDKEDPEKEFSYLNYDLVYPEGFGEGLSGGEREDEYQQILKRMKRLEMDLKPYETFLQLAEQGLLPKTAGAGFGVERLLKYLAGKRDIADVALFAKVPGTELVL